ncbi:hypothetical protein KUV50_18810 [Membranicola marinus]|uniref:Uncharacterized protein n=1 Tax=Membranihabitans marinus TaxID=1227546 RepID=A0A953I2V4_9BACT|nr:hypothetical protein [Membranihabitans marinus]MBY5960212.1 hypothetical protein [Membranihabitans marinus]
MINRRYDKVVVGALAGTVVPIFAFVVLYMIFQELSERGLMSDAGFSDDFRIRTIALVSIGVNVVLVRYFQKRYAHHAVRGVVFPTFVFIIAWIIYFSSVLL